MPETHASRQRLRVPSTAQDVPGGEDPACFPGEAGIGIMAPAPAEEAVRGVQPTDLRGIPLILAREKRPGALAQKLGWRPLLERPVPPVSLPSAFKSSEGPAGRPQQS